MIVLPSHCAPSSHLPLPLLEFVVFMFLSNVLPHDKENGSADEGVFNRAREEEGSGVAQQLAHDVILPLAQTHLTKRNR